MIVFGNVRALPKDGKFIPVNFTGMNESIKKLSFYNPYDFDITNPEFDKYFASIIFNNDNNFVSFFDIIKLLASGKNIFICITSNEVFDYMNEALAKLIQQRYGYNYQEVNNIEDIDYYDDSYFTIHGLYNYDIDDQRYNNIIMNNPQFIGMIQEDSIQ